MNPEFQRNLWLEAGPRRLAWAGFALAAIYGATLLIGDDGPIEALGVAGMLVFVATGLLWGPRIAGRAVGDEVGQRTWDFQRLSALEPWDMTWGKLFGATSLSWLAALSGLALAVLAVVIEESAVEGLQVVIGALGGAVLLQAGSMALALVGVRRARAEGRSAAFRFTFGGLIGLGLVLAAIGRTAPTGLGLGTSLGSLLGGGGAGIEDWWGVPIPMGWFIALSLAAFAAWAMVGAWRLMRLELQMRNLPWAWPLFVVFAGIWAAGLAGDAGTAWAASGVVFAACAYAAMFAEPAERVRLRGFGARALGGDWRGAAYDVPAAIAPVLLAAIAVGGISLTHGGGGPGGAFALAAFAFLVRDLGVVAYFRLGPRPGRGDFGAAVALFLVYFVGGVVGGNFGQGAGLALFLPSPDQPLVSVVSGAVMTAVVWVLAWKRIRAPEKSEA
jgi:hypothetical protein